MAAACVVSAVAQVPDPVIGVSFGSDPNNLVLTGTAAEGRTGKSYNKSISNRWIYQDPLTGKYIGTTDNDAYGFYYVMYDADDAIGQTFSGNTVTWEILFRLDKKECYSATNTGTETANGTAKFFSCQESGGWSLAYYPGNTAKTVSDNNLTYTENSDGGLVFQYVTYNPSTEKNVNTTVRPGMAHNIETGRFYHIVVTLDKTARTVRYYINGECVKNATGQNNLQYAYQPPKVGPNSDSNVPSAKTGSEKMWFNLGADVGNQTKPSNKSTQNSCRASYVFANIYNVALTEAQVKACYDNETVQYYTQSEPTTTSDLMWDVLPGADGSVADKSPYNDITVHGTLNTTYNSSMKRYMVVNNDINPYNYAYRDYHYDQSIMKRLSTGMAIEVYCKASEATWLPNHTEDDPETPTANTRSPLSFQQNGGMGLEFLYTGAVKSNYNNYGFNTSRVSEDKLAPAAGAYAFNISTPAGTLDDTYHHYVAVNDKENNMSYLYIDGVKVKEYEVPTNKFGGTPDLTLQHTAFPDVPHQWFCFNGDTKAHHHSDAAADTCEYGWKGNIVYGRVWGKALTPADVTALYNQATGTSTNVTVPANGVATAVFPYAAVVPAGATAYVVDVIKGSEANMVPYAAEGDVIPYGIPVIIKGDASTYTFNAADLNDDAVVAKIKTAPAKNLLVGSFATKKAKADQLYKISTSAAEFDKAAADDVLDAQQAWLPFEIDGEDALTLTENIVLTEAEGAASLDGYPEGYTATGKFSRTFKNAVSSTVCLPYAISSVSGGTLYSFDNITESEGEYTVNMSAASLPTTANTPYLFMPSADGEVTFSGMMTVPASVEAGNTTSGDWTFEGTYEKTTWSALPAGSSAVYGYAAKSQNTISPGDFVKLKMTGEAYTPAFRAVMKYTGGASARSLKGTVPTLPSRLKVVLTDGNGNVTEIGSLEILQEQETWFTIDGKELQAKPTKRGIYIRNGKKVFVK